MMLESIKKAAKLVAQDLMDYYHGDEPGNTVGILPGPPPDGDYYWWQGGAMWGTLIDYRHHFADEDFDDLITTAMLFQVGDGRDYMPANWSASMGNDDQAFWGIAAMSAAEAAFPNPPEDQPQWLALARCAFRLWSTQDALQPLEAMERQGHLRADDGRASGGTRRRDDP